MLKQNGTVLNTTCWHVQSVSFVYTHTHTEHMLTSTVLNWCNMAPISVDTLHVTQFYFCYLSLLRKISCRIPISRSRWICFSVLFTPGLTKLPVRVRGFGGVHGTLSSIVSWESRRAISNVCLSIINSRLAASPKSLILLTLTVSSEYKAQNN